MRRLFRQTGALVGVVVIGLAWAGAAAAQGPDKPYSQWSPQEQQQAASQIASVCQSQCMARADAGQRGALEASACVNACFVQHLPDDYPNMSALKHMAWSAYRSAQQMGSLTSSPPFPEQ
jgi:hypothetical protein